VGGLGEGVKKMTMLIINTSLFVTEHWQQSSSAHQSHYNKSAGGSKSRSESSGEKESDLTATSTYKNSFDSIRVDHDARGG